MQPVRLKRRAGAPAHPADPSATGELRPYDYNRLAWGIYNTMAMEHLAGARTDLARYLKMAPEAADAVSVRERLVELGGERPRLH